MRPTQRQAMACIRAVAAATALACTAPAAAQTRTARSTRDGATPIIRAVIEDPRVARSISRWGLSTADVQHDVAAMSPGQRARLAYVLTRRWRGSGSQAVADLQAQFLVTMSLMRESTLFAGVVSSNASGLR